MVSFIKSPTEFEMPSKFNRALRRWIVNPAVNYWIPRFMIVLFLKHICNSQVMRESFRSPGSWRVMKFCYERHPVSNWVDWLALKASAMAMGLRNRKKMVVSNLIRLFEEKRGKEMTVLGIGTGPALSILEAMGAAPWTHVNALCVDQDPSAIATGEELRDKLTLNGRVKFVQADALEAMSQMRAAPHVIEIVGLLEYLADRDVAQLLEYVYQVLQPGGTLIANSIQPSHGVQHFLERIFGMRLHYRREEALMGMMEGCGWRTFRIEREPIGIYSLVMAEKEV